MENKVSYNLVQLAIATTSCTYDIMFIDVPRKISKFARESNPSMYVTIQLLLSGENYIIFQWNNILCDK